MNPTGTVDSTSAAYGMRSTSRDSIPKLEADTLADTLGELEIRRHFPVEFEVVQTCAPHGFGLPFGKQGAQAQESISNCVVAPCVGIGASPRIIFQVVPSKPMDLGELFQNRVRNWCREGLLEVGEGWSNEMSDVIALGEPNESVPIDLIASLLQNIACIDYPAQRWHPVPGVAMGADVQEMIGGA